MVRFRNEILSKESHRPWVKELALAKLSEVLSYVF